MVGRPAKGFRTAEARPCNWLAGRARCQNCGHRMLRVKHLAREAIDVLNRDRLVRTCRHRQATQRPANASACDQILARPLMLLP